MISVSFLDINLSYMKLDLNHFVVFNYTLPDSPNTKSSDDPLLLVPQFCKTESHKASFVNRIVPMWNQLPLSIRTAASMATFKSQLTEFYKSKLQ